MAVETEPTTKLFHGVCPSCETVGLEISGASDDGRLSCPNCEWDSSLPAGELDSDETILRPAG